MTNDIFVQDIKSLHTIDYAYYDLEIFTKDNTHEDSHGTVFDNVRLALKELIKSTRKDLIDGLFEVTEHISTTFNKYLRVPYRAVKDYGKQK